MGYYKQREIEAMDDDGLANEAIKKRNRNNRARGKVYEKQSRRNCWGKTQP